MPATAWQFHRPSWQSAPQPARLIYYGIPLPSLNSSIDRSFDLAILGRIHPVKQHLLFLKICEQLSEGAASSRPS